MQQKIKTMLSNMYCKVYFLMFNVHFLKVCLNVLRNS